MDAAAVIEGVALVLSNLAIVPAIVKALWLQQIPEAAVLSVVLVVSSVYHVCQAGFACVLDIEFETLQLADHFFVFSALMWIVLLFVGIELEFRVALFVWLQLLLLPLLLEFMRNEWFGPVAIGVVVVLVVLLLALVVRGVPHFNRTNMLIAAVLLAVGFALHLLAGDPLPPTRAADGGDGEPELVSQPRYSWFHVPWHVFAMAAVYFALDLHQRKGWVSRSVRRLSHHHRNDDDDNEAGGARSSERKTKTTAVAPPMHVVVSNHRTREPRYTNRASARVIQLGTNAGAARAARALVV
ncbi:hypothetical protein LCGC14_1791470 [marine sediment metagenome]|uniref:Ceramidase n=1 Tax=marine sediment metagenome TaxID=412755 RepID=A0A0F9GSF4_9ZZZZ